jgi:hypothetical protein
MFFGGNKVPTKEELQDDGAFVFYPQKIGNSILICGKRQSSFPFQLFVS